MLKTYQEILDNNINPVNYFNFLVAVANQLTLSPAMKDTYNQWIINTFVYNPEFISTLSTSLREPTIQTPEMSIVK